MNKKITQTGKIFLLATSIGATLWFLIRVIPKPSRASYPCMQAAAPFMSALVIYITSLLSSIYIFKIARQSLFSIKTGVVLLLIALALFSFSITNKKSALMLNSPSYYKANEPMGEAKGIFPGRVVWVHDAAATNENTANKSGDYWFMDKNCDQTTVDGMLSNAVKGVAGKAVLTEAWNDIFVYFNKNHGKGEVGYKAGEKVAIKINLTNSCCQSTGSDIMDATPQLVLAILKQLVDVVGVEQKNIWIGDNYRTFRAEYWNKCHTVYPNVHYVDGNGGNGREQTVPSAEQLLVFSDGKETSSIPQHYVDAAYLINMPCLKSHDVGGITLAAKNHQGSFLAEGTPAEGQSAMAMHYSLPGENQKLGQFRHLVDYMGHKDLGGKTLLYVVDALWAGKNWNGILEKWEMAPFNGDYPSSLILSQDAVAIESVGYDFLLAEYASKDESEQYPYIQGVDDYLMQAADPANWPVNINYDPEGDGTILKSLGVYEHWNNETDMKYSRNLGTGNGIELVKVDNVLSVSSLNADEPAVYPNPFKNELNIAVEELQNVKLLELQVYNMNAQMVHKQVYSGSIHWTGASALAAGSYQVKVKDLTTGKLVVSETVFKTK